VPVEECKLGGNDVLPIGERYRDLPDQLRRTYNQAWFTRIYLDAVTLIRSKSWDQSPYSLRLLRRSKVAANSRRNANALPNEARERSDHRTPRNSKPPTLPVSGFEQHHFGGTNRTTIKPTASFGESAGWDNVAGQVH